MFKLGKIEASGANGKWASVGSPPEGINKITYSEPQAIWVEAESGTYFKSESKCCNEDCWQTAIDVPIDEWWLNYTVYAHACDDSHWNVVALQVPITECASLDTPAPDGSYSYLYALDDNQNIWI